MSDFDGNPFTAEELAAANASNVDAPPEGLPARRAALVAIGNVVDGSAWSNIAVPQAIESLPSQRDRAFAAHLAHGVIRHKGTLDWALGHALSRPIGHVENKLANILRLGALQLVLPGGVAPHAAISTSVDLAREVVPAERAKGASGFVNGALRGLQRKLDTLPWPSAASDPVQHLVLRTAHPRWIVEELLARFDVDRVRAILAADNAAPGVTLRAVGDRDVLAAELRELGLDVTPTAGAAQGLRVPGADPRVLAAVQEGRAQVQDEASMLVVEAAGVEPGSRVLDLCAGPGGKTSHLAALAGPEGQVVAVEKKSGRARMVREAVARGGFEVDVIVGDGTDPRVLGDREPGFDVVVVDAPCSGLGTGRRRPEVRWRRTPEDVAALHEIQLGLVLSGAKHVRPGGRLVYSACTWTAAETDGIADLVDEMTGDGQMIRSPGMPRLEAGPRRQLWPDSDDTDGMYVASWTRPV